MMFFTLLLAKMMIFSFLTLVIGNSIFNQASANFQQSGLYRDENRQITFGNFKLDHGFKLSATKIASSMVSDIFDCVHICLNGANCKSLNFAVNPYSNGLYQCELLDTDKYRVDTVDIQPDVAFFHYSPWVS